MSIQIDNLTDAILIIPDVTPSFVNLLCRPDLAHLPPGCTFPCPALLEGSVSHKSRDASDSRRSFCDSFWTLQSVKQAQVSNYLVVAIDTALRDQLKKEGVNVYNRDVKVTRAL